VLTPFIWKRADIDEAIQAAARLLPLDDRGGRRSINMRHPAYPDRMSHTLVMQVQCLLPGEIATTHRHSPSAIRFVIQGSPHAFTIVDGEPMPMETGDLITTPNWTWHDHRNEGDQPVLWVDGLDARLVSTWRGFWEEGDPKQQELTKPAGFASKVFGRARPLWLKNVHRTPPMRYPWSHTLATLTALQESEAEGDPYDGIRLSFAHPLGGGATLPSFACEIQLLPAGREMQAHRHLSTAVYYVVSGTGATMVKGEPLAWSQGDIFLIPPWAAHRHENRGQAEAILFSLDDRPTTEALGLFREEETTL
jgi:gentisate 1,2-dioxygenase